MQRIFLSEEGYTPRTFRKTFITICSRIDINPSVIAELVGHTHRSTADRFYNKISVKQMNAALDKFPSVESFSNKT